MSPVLVDSHCHLNCLEDYETKGVKKYLDNANENDVNHFLCVAIDIDGIDVVKTIAEENPQVWCSAGLHPNETIDVEPSLDQFISYAEHPKVVAIGETGLDYYYNKGDLEWQRQRFRNQIQAANHHNLPVIVHSRDAAEDTLAILQEQKADVCGGVMHCFTYDYDMAKKFIDFGFYISFSGIVTFKNAKELQEAAKNIPLDRVLVETDSPYLAPVPYRGKPNEPAYVRHTAEFIAQLRGISYEEVAVATTHNFFEAFQKAKKTTA